MKVDRDILLFLWRWKLLSSSAIAARFFPGATSSGANKRLERLRRHNLIYPFNMNSNEAKVLWSLTSKGFREARVRLPELSETGFRSEHPLHDYYVTAIHLGEWLTRIPQGCDLFSEQELRRYSPDNFPGWVPTNTLHRSDGYWKIRLPEGNLVAALEVELNLKTKPKYGVVAQYYKDQPNISRVIWVVETSADARKIRDALKASSPSNIGIHTFILLPDFLSRGWDAPIQYGFEEGRPLSCLLRFDSGETQENSSAFSLLDTRKWPSVSEPSANFSKEPISLLARHGRALPHSQSEHDFQKQAGLPRPADSLNQTRRTTQ